MHASPQKVVTSIYLDRTMKAALEFEAARDGQSVSGLVRRACDAYLADVATPENEKASGQVETFSKQLPGEGAPNERTDRSTAG
jgi:hypothetical protein